MKHKQTTVATGRVNGKGFTLIELLVVVGILAVLAIAALIAINPLEAQRKARDSSRLTDIARLQSVIEAYINDEGAVGITNGNHQSNTVGQVRSESCDSGNWIGGIDLCPYLKQVPLDPMNARRVSVLDPGAPGGRAQTPAAGAGYGFFYDTGTGDYEFCMYLEADKNDEILNTDGGSTDNLFETGTDLTLACAP